MDDMQYGIGIEIWNDSSQYSGEYNNGKKEGIGTYIWTDQTMYQGEWKNNVLEGFGIYLYANGKKYLGEWKIVKCMDMVNFNGRKEKNI